MKSVYCRFCLTLTLVAASGPAATPGWSQISPDATVDSLVISNGTTLQIDGGRVAGTNLFHSFQEFSVPTGTTAFFNNPLSIENIITRVTGSKISNIDGILRANGTANLFLLNPNGILFGPNAQLNIGGSFIGTTAESIKFADGTLYTTQTPSTAPLLTVSTPIGLQLGVNAGPIQVAGSGNIQTFAPNTSPSDSNQSVSGLQVPENQTLALVGSEINLIGGTLKAPDGRVELWAAQNAQLTMNNQADWQLASPAATANWGTISLRQTALVDASGTNGGAIQVRARGLTVQNGSNISSVTNGGQGQGIIVQTTDFIDLLGASSPQQLIFSGIGTAIGNSPATGRAGDVTVKTNRLRMANGAAIQSSSMGDGSRTGDLSVRASDIEVQGFNPFPFSLLDGSDVFFPTGITTLVFGGTNNEAGNITIEANRLRIADGGSLSSDIVSSFLESKAGNISIRATESVEISGATPDGFLASIGNSVQPFAAGQGGNITIQTGRLQLAQGGTIRSNLAGIGKAGNINIQATEVTLSDPRIDRVNRLFGGITASVGPEAVGPGGTINLTANRLQVFNGGQIISSSLGQGDAGNINLQVNNIDIQGVSQSLFNGQPLPSSIAASSSNSFAAGSINVITDHFQVKDDAQISVSNFGSGNAGNLNISSDSLFFNNAASLRAEVSGGDQGNINLNVDDVLLMRNGSHITTNATGMATGGNITINTPVMAGLENSDIAANAIQGAGGNIQISTQGIFGLEFRDQPTDQSDITASSQFGVSGNVSISTPDVQPDATLVNLPANLIDPNAQITSGCDLAANNHFIATGRGGLPPNPTQRLESQEHPWSDVRDLSAFRRVGTQAAMSSSTPSKLVEANAWQLNQQGQVEIYVSESAIPNFLQPTCAGSALSAL